MERQENCKASKTTGGAGMIHTVKPIKNLKRSVNGFGDLLGGTAIIALKTNQKWKAKYSKRYWYVTRKGCPITLRLTDTAFNRLFEVI